MKNPRPSLNALQAEIVQCRACPRLVAWRKKVANEKVRRFADETYWGKPLPGFGDAQARVVLVGLAPAAHGGNRTGRVFTGDESGRWLFRALYREGFANQPESVSRNDGLRLTNCYVTAAVRCAPPQNKPLTEEFRNCQHFLEEELLLLKHIRVVVGLGAKGFAAVLSALQHMGMIIFSRRPVFGHKVEYKLGDIWVLGSYHPSQQNTFTGKLTEEMLQDVMRAARRRMEE
jgi:uracil-DNA glycosylase family 4